MQKILYCNANSDNGEIFLSSVNKLLEQGWSVVSVTAQHVSRAGETVYKKDSYGGVIVVLDNNENIPKL